MASLICQPLSAQTSRSLVRRAAAAHVLSAAAVTTLVSESFSSSATTAGAWLALGDACLTAGTTSTPTTSIRACGSAAPQDAAGKGALQLTAEAASHVGMVISKTALPTANGLQITFTDDSFHGTTPGSEGVALFFTDASQPLPTTFGAAGGGIGYSGTTSFPGLAHGYLGIGLDEYGSFSSSAGGFTGGPGIVPETIAARGAAATGYAYLGGVSVGGKPASLPFAFNVPAQTTRPATAPTIQATLTPGGLLSVAVDQHDGRGFTTYYSQSIVGVHGQPAVPAKVYFGLSASTGSHYNVHQVTGLAVSTVPPTALLSESFSGTATTPSAWESIGGACLTAGTSATPTTSIPACKSKAPQDAAGHGTLELTAAQPSTFGIVVNTTPLSTANGLQISFTDYAFDGTSPGSEGVGFFLTDASKAFPTGPGQLGGGLAYAGTSSLPGIANGYLGVAFDEFGSFSSSNGGFVGGPGVVPETIAARGAASTKYHYLGGVINGAGSATSLPFALDTPTLKTRPTIAPTFTATLSPAGLLSVAIDRHNGVGAVTYYSQSIVGVSGQPAVPAKVYFGLTASTGSHYAVHQIAGLTVATSSGVVALSVSTSSVAFAAPTSGSQTVSIAGGTAPYSVSGCANVAGGSIAGSVLTVKPIAAGLCTLVISDAQANSVALAVSVSAPTVGSALDNLTFHRDVARTGWYKNETILNTTTVASGNFGELGTLAAPAGLPALGKVYAQPLFASGETVNGTAHNLVIIAGSTGQVYAFDESTLGVVWHRSFTDPANGIRQQLWTDTGCSDVSPDTGIVGTPVIDRSHDALYVVVATNENGTAYTRLHAIGLSSGNDLVAPTVISGTVVLSTGGTASISSAGNMNRPALLEANGNIYIGLGSHCDAGGSFIHGWLASYSASTLQQTGALVDLTNANRDSGYLGSIWMSGFGPAADAQGNVYFATGNGPFDGVSDFGMSVLKVPADLNLAGASYFAPIQAAQDSANDQDLGAGGVLLLPDQAGAIPHLLIAGGKCDAAGCVKYLLNRDSLGGQQSGNVGAVWSANTGGPMFGGPAYFADSSGGQHIVYGGEPLNTYNLNLSPYGLSVQSSVNVGCLECRESGGSQPVVSSNGTQSGSAVVWAIKDAGSSGGSVALYAFNALSLGTTLFHGTAGTWTKVSSAPDVGAALVSPLIADGRVYVPTDGSVAVFGLH